MHKLMTVQQRKSKNKTKKTPSNYFVCTVAQLPGSPEAAVIDLSSPFLQHVILSPLPLSGACQRDQVGNIKILPPLSTLSSEQNHAALMDIVVLSKTT